MKIINTIKNTCKLTALISFLIGTLLVVLFAMDKTNNTLVITGIYYIYIAVIINVILLVGAVFSALYYWDYRLELFAHSGLLLLNIPIAIGYFFIILKLVNF